MNKTTSDAINTMGTVIIAIGTVVLVRLALEPNPKPPGPPPSSATTSVPPVTVTVAQPNTNDDPQRTPTPRRHEQPHELTGLSRDLSDSLHHNLPCVDARVFGRGDGRPNLVKLWGKARRNQGREDAKSESEQFLNARGLHFENLVEVDQRLVAPPGSSCPSEIAYGQQDSNNDPGTATPSPPKIVVRSKRHQQPQPQPSFMQGWCESQLTIYESNPGFYGPGPITAMRANGCEKWITIPSH